MDISKYVSFFHDGSIIDIVHNEENIIISMESAEVNEEDIIEDKISLSQNNRICGKLHLEQVKSIKEDEEPCTNLFEKKYELAEVFHLKIENTNIQMEIIWNAVPPSTRTQGFSVIEIVCEKVWWEPIPFG